MSAKDDATRAAHRLSKVVVNLLYEAEMNPNGLTDCLKYIPELGKHARQYEEAYRKHLKEAS